MTVKLPYVIGPRVSLRLNRGVFTGSIDGRPVNLRIDQGEIVGTGPMGAVSVVVSQPDDRLTIEGTWNQSRVHFEITDRRLVGSIATYQPRASSFERMSRVGDAPRYCQYVLDRVEPSGVRAGISICDGSRVVSMLLYGDTSMHLPEETMVEIPPALHGWLTRDEMVVVLLALLSSPPLVSVE
jgi:hypothetical protein